MKKTSINELTDQIIGPIGSPSREEFEHELQLEVLGELLKQKRKEKQLTQAELGEILGIGKSQISKLENSTKDFRLGTLLRAFQALNLKVKVKLEDSTSEVTFV